MAYFNQKHQAPVEAHPAPVSAYPPHSYSPPQGPYVAAPPPMGYPTKDGSAVYAQHAAPAETRSKGDGFWKGCCAALCCCCVLDACF